MKQSGDKEKLKESLFNILRTIYQFERYSVLTFGLNYQEIYLMNVLKRQSPKKMSEVSAELRIEAFSSSRLVSRMAAKGLIKRYKAGSDKRNVFVALTDKGETLTKKISDSSLEVIQKNFKKADPKTVESFFNAAANIHEILKMD